MRRLFLRLYYAIKFYMIDRRRCVHEFTMENWTDLNGDPRCMHCGDYLLDKIVKEQPRGYFNGVQITNDKIQWRLK